MNLGPPSYLLFLGGSKDIFFLVFGDATGNKFDHRVTLLFREREWPHGKTDGGGEENVGEGVVPGKTFIGVKNAVTAEERELPIFGPVPSAPHSSPPQRNPLSSFLCLF